MDYQKYLEKVKFIFSGDLSKRNKIYATHVRNRDNHYDLGFIEALTTARQFGVKLSLIHI